jgi:hypothetical protein
MFVKYYSATLWQGNALLIYVAYAAQVFQDFFEKIKDFLYGIDGRRYVILVSGVVPIPTARRRKIEGSIPGSVHLALWLIA